MANNKSTENDKWGESSYPKPESSPRNALAIFVALVGIVLIVFGIWGALRYGDWWYDYNDIGSGPPLMAILPLLLGILVIIIAILLYENSAPLVQTTEAAPPLEDGVITIYSHDIALAELAGIMVEGLVARGEYIKHYKTVSQILRCYLEDLYGIPAPDLTTAEVIAQMTAQGLVTEHIERCRQLLREADLVKFAQFQPTLAEAQELIPRVRAFIELTSPSAKEL